MFFCRIAVAENGSCPEYSFVEQVNCSSAEICREEPSQKVVRAARDVFVAIAYFIYIFLHPFRADARGELLEVPHHRLRVADARV